MYEAENYWQKKEYSKFIALLSKSELDLTDLMRKKIDMAKKKIKQNN
ncbi:hypothetical protein C8E08_0760 [Paracidovorax citrulli]|nr:hypothetical protein C8E08_0760 [Paracidovorax citrulli]REG67559.1 hypothetical protein C8E07_0627 [Paracidovorax citrulli]